jgi:FixJ family two-component response regulator
VHDPDSHFCRIAIVDDDADVRAALGSLLRSYGYSVTAYESALDFLAGGGLAACHCIVTDLQMPGMSGIELLEKLRGCGNPIPTVLMTAYPEAALRQRALQAGAICFLAKPFEANDLMRCLQKAHDHAVPPPSQE